MSARSPISCGITRLIGICALLLAVGSSLTAQTVLRPARVFDGSTMHEGWAVRVQADRIEAAGPSASINAAGAKVVDLPGTTLMPGLVEGHSHVLLHPYNETVWNDQVLHEGLALRAARAVNHLRATLMAGFTTIRDLGSEGAGYADISLRQAINDGSMQGPLMFVATRAIVARGAYGPRRTGFRPDMDLPQGAQEASGVAEMVAAVREQMAHGADWIKIYADYRFGNSSESRPTFTQEEMNAAVATAHDAGVRVAVHAVTDEGMRRAALAGADTIEHGYNGTRATFQLMARRHVAFIPTLSAAETVRRGDSARAPAAFRLARDAHVTIANGSDAGVFPHGQNARELELMVENGMSARDAMIAATVTNARVLGHTDQLGVIAPNAQADIAGFTGDPTADIHALRNVVFVMRRGVVVREDAAN